MRLRIYFPWGLLLTVLGFAGLGAAAAYWLAMDVHGHLYRQCVLQAIGGGLLGLLGWTFSERIAFVANLNTSPFLRLALPGAGAVYLAAEVAAPLTEFTAGTGAYWAEVVAVGVYLAAGVLPLVAGVALLAAGETLLAAQRGNADLASALRPVLPHALLGVALAGVVGFSTVYLHDRIRAGVLTFVPDRLRTSAWLARRQALFVEVLRGAACEVLVAPFETRGTTGGWAQAFTGQAGTLDHHAPGGGRDRRPHRIVRGRSDTGIASAGSARSESRMEVVSEAGGRDRCPLDRARQR